MNKNYTEGIDPKTGEYFYREHKRNGSRPTPFMLDFINPRQQLTGLCSEVWIARIEDMILHKKALKMLGVLPDNYERRVERQINLKAVTAMARFRKNLES